MKKYTSIKIANLSWVCSILVVLIHSTTYAFNLPGSNLGTIYGKNISTFVQMFFAEGVCRIAVPLFFIFSGYLFFQNFSLTFGCITNKFKRRIFSLVIPYLFWSIGTFMFFYIAQSIPATAAYFSSRSVVGIGFKSVLNYIFVDSLNSPLWYLRNLIILTVFTPLIYVLIKKLWFIVLPIAGVCGIMGIGFLTVRGIAFFTFTLGSFFAVKSEMLCEWLSKLGRFKAFFTALLNISWFLILVGKAYYLCSLDAGVLLSGRSPALLNILNGINIVVGIPAVWLLYDFINTKHELDKTELGKCGMMIFVMHHPIIAILKKVLLIVIGNSMLTSLICYFASAAITIAIIVVFSFILKKYAKGLYGFISGGR